MRPHECPFVFVEWVDAVTRHGWEDMGEIQRAKPEVVVSAGWMLERNAQQVSLASDVGRDDSSTNRRLHVPLGMVLTITQRDGTVLYSKKRRRA